MRKEDLFHRLKSDVKPSKTASERMKARIMREIDSPLLRTLKAETHPTASFAQKVKERLLGRIHLPTARVLPSFKETLSPSRSQRHSIWDAISGQLEPVHVNLVGSGIKWTAAFAIFVLIVRLMPLALLAPATQAQSKVELIPEGAGVDVLVGGIHVPVNDRYTLQNPALITTGEHGATIVLHDDAVIRLAPRTSIRLHDLTDRPEPTLPSTFSFIKGKIWVLGLLPPTVDSVLIDLPNNDQLMINEGSLSIDDENGVSIDMFAHRAAVRHDAEMLYLVTNERLTLAAGQTYTGELSKRDLSDEWVIENLNRDSAHREVLVALKRERREKIAGILPTSILYPVKRVAEEVDVLFTVGNEAKAEKRIQQADTRLNEALALLNEGDIVQASAPLAEYKQTILSLASGSGDNLVKFLIKKQLNEASTDIASIGPQEDMYAVKQSVLEMSAQIPNAEVGPEEVQSYLLVDKLASIDQALTNSGSVQDAIAMYQSIQPYLQNLLTQTGSTPPTALQREAKTLLANAAESIEALKSAEPENVALDEVREDIDQFLPKAPEKVPEAPKQDISVIVQGIVDRIFLYKLPRSRENQFRHELKQLESNPDRGSILRQLYYALPENGFARDVRLEIGKLGAKLEYERNQE